MNPLFSFGIITDTHVRAPEGDQSSPFPVNDLANDRAAYASQLLASLKPAFSIHLGDMVHPLPHMESYLPATNEAKKLFAPLAPDIFYVPGNHDIGDKPMPGAPAAAADSRSTAIYQSEFGRSWYLYQHEDCLFVVINSSILNTGVPEETEQRIWLEASLDQHLGKRIFLFSHYPPFIHDEHEPEHYDNIAQPGRKWLLSLVKLYGVEVVFSGHVHHYFYNNDGHTAYYCLPATSFTRQDYAELFAVSPAPEYGRNDTGKFSVAVVEIYQNGYQLKVVPTNGNGLANTTVAGTVVKTNAVNRSEITLHLRHAWHASIDLPYNGPMEEFSRKRVRNDYTHLRLTQMGIKSVRVPSQDLMEPEIQQLMVAYAKSGINFQLFQLGVPDAEMITNLHEHSHLISQFECVVTDTASMPITETIPLLLSRDELAELSKINIALSKAHSSAHTNTGGKPFAHSVSSGFLWSECSTVLKSIDKHDKHKLIASVVFQVPLEDELEKTLDEMQKTFETHNISCIANIRLAPGNPATANFDDVVILNRVSSAIEHCESNEKIQLQFDTFADVDRGYAPRYGFVDRRYNLRPAGRYLCNF